MGVKIEDIKPGDKVRGGWYEVVSIGSLYAQVRLDNRDEVSVRVDSIVEHVPAPREIKVGDRVTWGTGDYAYTVLAIVEKKAWIASEDWPVHLLSDLRHV